MAQPARGRSVDARLFRAAAVPVLAVGAVVVVAATVSAGGRGTIGAAIGVVLVVGFFGAGLLVARWTARSHPTMVLSVALASYVLKITLLALFLVLFRGTELFDVRSFAVAVLVCAVLWLAAEVRAVGRLRVPLDLSVPRAGEREPEA